MCLNKCLEWFNSGVRKKMWLDLDEDPEVDTYNRISKQYELIGILSGLVTGTFGMILDNKNIVDEYKYVYSIVAGLGLLFSLSTVLLSLIIISLMGVVRKKDIRKFIEECSQHFTAPVVFLFISITFMFTSVVLYFGTPVTWFLIPIGLFLYIYNFILYCDIRNKVLKLE